MKKVEKGNYAEVNGLNLYYEIHGTGEPLILLHGGLGATEMFSDVLPGLAQDRQVIAVDLQAHGRTADIDRPLKHELLAEDIAALAEQLELEKVDVMGYSFGGGTALRTAIQYPRLVRKLVVVSFPHSRASWYPEVLASMEQLGPQAADAMKSSPMYELYADIAPRPEDFPVLLGKMGELMRQDYDWSQEVAKLELPTLLVFADADSVSPGHAAEFYGLLGGGQKDAGWDGSSVPQARLAILPGTTHYNVVDSPLLPRVVTEFLEAPAPKAA